MSDDINILHIMLIYKPYIIMQVQLNGDWRGDSEAETDAAQRGEWPKRNASPQKIIINANTNGDTT